LAQPPRRSSGSTARIALRSSQACPTQRGAPSVGETELERVLGRQERNDARSIDVLPEVGDEVADVVLLLRADRAVGQADEGVAAGEGADRVVGVDPRAHAGVRVELGAGRAQLRRDDDAQAGVRRPLQRFEETCPHARRVGESVGAQFCFTL
jgi:hypothetical protein